MNPSDSAYPLQTHGDVIDNGAKITNHFEGGMSKREMIAMQCLQGLLANPALAGMKNSDTFLTLAFGMADRFLVASIAGLSSPLEMGEGH